MRALVSPSSRGRNYWAVKHCKLQVRGGRREEGRKNHGFRERVFAASFLHGGIITKKGNKTTRRKTSSRSRTGKKEGRLDHVARDRMMQCEMV